MRRRLDAEIVRRGLASDIDGALALIKSRRVLVDGAPTDKPGRLVDPGESISLVKERSRYVGRGGEKLHGAIGALGLDVTGHHVLDVGASTGGFTDAALQHGAASVVAVDVGRGQLHDRLRRDPRVEIRDRVNVRLVDPVELGEFDSVIGDLSFISLTRVIDNLIACTRPGGQLVLLVKPQFEVSAQDAGHNRGVIREPHLWTQALERTVSAALGSGAVLQGVCASPIQGADGNVEFFIHLRRDGSTSSESQPIVDGLSTPDGNVAEPAGSGSSMTQLPAEVREMISVVVESVAGATGPVGATGPAEDQVGHVNHPTSRTTGGPHGIDDQSDEEN